MNKESSFLKKFGFHLENLIPISLYDEKEIKNIFIKRSKYRKLHLITIQMKV